MNCMNRKINVCVAVIAFTTMLNANVQSADTKAVVEGNTAFAFDLYARLKGSPDNLFFSPYSISTALAMTYAGARGETAKQMAGVLHFTQSEAQPHADFGQLQSDLNGRNQEGIELDIANALWAQKGARFLPGFMQIATQRYAANVKQADFVTAAESARKEINSWVAHQTKDKIQNILPSGSVDSLTRLVLADAIYFKGTWVKPFDKRGTRPQPFHLAGAQEVSAPLMYHVDQVRYSEEAGMQAVELPYKGDGLSMIVLLPRQTNGCGTLESALSPALLSKVLSGMKSQEVEIYLPRFKLESDLGLAKTLVEMGMPDAFSAKADFSGIDGTRSLYISAVFHKAWGEVNEEGTEAAAATAVVMAKSMAMRKPGPPRPVFRADHPFVFLIRDTKSGTVLFLGRLANPG
jgi:serine protease inhibitor